MNNEICKNCNSNQLEYCEDLYRYSCNVCNALTDLQNIGVTGAEYIKSKYFNNLHMKIPVKRNESVLSKMSEHMKKIKPFRLEDLFRWILEQQMEAMRPFVRDHGVFVGQCNELWDMYLSATGSGYDVQGATMEELLTKKYALGWGVPVDPNRPEETLSIVPRELFKLYREEQIELENQRNERDSRRCLQNNAKKLKIEKIVKEKFTNKLIKTKILNVESIDEKKGPLLEEEDPNFINTIQLGENERKVMRILGINGFKKSYFGGRGTTGHMLMEINLLLMFYALHFTGQGTRQCCCLLDIWRLAHKGLIPFLKVTKILPMDRFYVKHAAFQSMVMREVMPSFSNLKHCAFFVAETLDLAVLLKPDIDIVAERSLSELNLPSALIESLNFIHDIVYDKLDEYFKLQQLSTIIQINSKWTSFKAYGQHILVPELSCRAYIFIALRMMMRFDGIFEGNISNLAKIFNGSDLCDDTMTLFIWRDWLNDQYCPPTINTAKSWEDLGRVTSAKIFVEDEFLSDTKGEENEFVNVCGVLVDPYKKETSNDVLNGMRSIFYDIIEEGDRTKCCVSVPDYKDTKVDYLLEEKLFQEMINKKHARSGSTYWQVLDQLVGMVNERPLCVTTLGLDEQRYPWTMSCESITVRRMTRAEHHLTDILIWNTGITRELLHDTATSIIKIILKM